MERPHPEAGQQHISRDNPLLPYTPEGHRQRNKIRAAFGRSLPTVARAAIAHVLPSASIINKRKADVSDRAKRRFNDRVESGKISATDLTDFVAQIAPPLEVIETRAKKRQNTPREIEAEKQSYAEFVNSGTFTPLLIKSIMGLEHDQPIRPEDLEAFVRNNPDPTSAIHYVADRIRDAKTVKTKEILRKRVDGAMRKIYGRRWKYWQQAHVLYVFAKERREFFVSQEDVQAFNPHAA